MKPTDESNELTTEFADAVLENNWNKAYEICTSLAKKGNSRAEHTLGWFYEQGVVVAQSDEKAFNWWSITAPKGVPESQAGLGVLYLYGRGTEINYQKACYWLSLALRNNESYIKQDLIKAKKELTLWQLLYVKLLLLKT